MPSIGAVTCTFVRGTPHVGVQRVHVWETAGIDGYGAQLLGLGDCPFQVLAVCVDAAPFGVGYTNVAQWGQNIQALQGTIVSIINDWGTTYQKCLIAKTSQIRISVFGNGAKGEILIEGVST